MTKGAIPTVRRMMDFHGNDWSSEAKVFRRALGKELVSEEPLDQHIVHDHVSDTWKTRKHLSIVVPIVGRARYLQRTVQVLGCQTFIGRCPELVELLVVHDGPAPNPEDDPETQLFPWVPPGIRTRFFRLSENKGPSTARNVGIYFADGDIILFLDSDMLLEPRFLAEHMIRHEYLSNLAIVGFRSDIEMDDPNAQVSDGTTRFSVDWRADWRARPYHVKVPSVLNGKKLDRGETVRIYEATSGFRKWRGGINGRSLPSVFQTCCVSVPRQHVMGTGGFRNIYKGWGLEDRDVGSRLLARGVRLVPCISTAARHLKHPESATKDRDEEANLRRYDQMMGETYRENSRLLVNAVNGLRKMDVVREIYTYEGGTLQRGGQTRYRPAQPPVRERLARFASHVFRGANTRVCRLSVEFARVLDQRRLVIGPTDLKWTLILEDHEHKQLIEVSRCNMEEDPDRGLVFPLTIGFVGKNFAKLNGYADEDGEQDVTERWITRVLEGDALRIDLSSRDDAWRTAVLGMSADQISRTRHISFITSFPIRLWMGEKGKRPFYLPCMFNVHSSRIDLAGYFGLKVRHATGAGFPSAEGHESAEFLHSEIYWTFRGVRDTLEEIYNEQEVHVEQA